MKYITGKISVWLLAISCWLLAGCSSDDTGEQADGRLLRIVAYTADYQHEGTMRRAVADGYSVFTPDRDVSVGVFMIPNGATTAEAKYLRYSNNYWHSQAAVAVNTNYNIFGFMPKLEQMEPSITKNGSNVSLTLANIKTVTEYDVCFITGVKDQHLSGDLVQGSFSYVGKDDNNDILMLMDHLYGSLRFTMKMGVDYAALRTIKLKSMTLQAPKATATATIVLTPNNTGESPIQDITFSTAGTSCSATFFSDTAGQELSTSPYNCVATCYFAPAVADNLTLITTYDVYDTKGNKIRENCEATNNLPNLEAARGQQVTINMTVSPTYLYVLSDPDLDNPTITVN